MKIFMTADAVGGVWDYSAMLAHGLVTAGHAVRIAAVGGADDDRLALLPEPVEVVAADYLLEWMPGAARDVDAAGRWLATEARGWGADLVHLNQLAYAAHDFGAPTLVVVHSDVLSWFSEVTGGAAPDGWSAYREWVALGLESAHTVAAPSRYQSDLIARHYGRPADRIIHNGLIPPFSAPRRRERPLALSVGRAWDEAKGMAVVDRAAGQIGEDLPVHVFGEPRGPDGQRFVARHAAAHGRVTRTEVDEWLARASIYVGASFYEPFGLAPLEAAFSGAALVLSDIPSFRELWDGCATFFPPGDATALARVLEDLMPDLGRCAALGAAARARALARFTADRTAAEYLGLYAEMLPQPRLERCV